MIKQMKYATIAKRLLQAMLVVNLLVPLSAKGQVGYLDKYPSMKKGERVISRVSDDGRYRVSCIHVHDIANFVVTDGTVSYNYPTSHYVENDPLSFNPVLNKGYSIKDIQLVGDTCWFCGTYWEETGEWIYTMQGLAYWEVLHTGFVGFSLLSSMATGSCPVWYVTTPGIDCLDKMAVYPNGVAAIGRYYSFDYRDHFQRLFVELKRSGNDSQWGYNSQCEYSIGETTFPDEEFRDITFTGDKIVVLSRFPNSPRYEFHVGGIGLSYGTPGSFLSSNRSYTYFLRDIDGSSDFCFNPEAPLVFDKTRVRDGVVVGYVCNPLVLPYYVDHRGELMFLVVDSENDQRPEIIYNRDNQRYKSVEDMSVLSSGKVVALLEDSLGNSVVRFPQLQGGYEKILSFAGPKLMSVASFASSSNDMGVYAGGVYLDSQNRLACMYEKNILTRINSWPMGNCASKKIGSSHNITFQKDTYFRNRNVEEYMTSTTVMNVMKFYPSDISSVRMCTDVR